MARKNRSQKRSAPHTPLNVDKLGNSWRRTEIKRGREWTVQPISEVNATKTYTCPGCQGEIPPGMAHVASWRNDGVLGDAADLENRRHWHNACWKVS